MILVNKKILIVEDNYEVYENLVDFFEKKGLIVIRNKDPHKAVDNYNDAKALADEHDPDIAVIDIHLKGTKTGLDLCDHIKANFNTFILILSDSRSTADFNKARSLFVDDYVRKIEKTADNERLWDTINFHYPFKVGQDKHSGREYNVYEHVTPKGNDREFAGVFIYWERLQWIESNLWPRNSISFYTYLPDKRWIARGSLNEVIKTLPPNFVRINRSQIINTALITAKKSKFVHCIGGKEFTISSKYYDDFAAQMNKG